MATRGRPKKPRLSRMDAAIDAMTPLGYSRDLVRKTLQKILKEYGGDEGWPFIEVDCYNVLINAILAEEEKHEETNGQEICAEGRNTLLDASLQDKRAGDLVSSATTEPSTVVEPPCCENINSTSQTANTEYKDSPLSAEVARNDWKDIVLDQGISQNEILDAAGEKEEFPSGAVDLQYARVYSPPPILPSNNFIECEGSPLPAEGAQNYWKDIVLDPSSEIHQNEIHYAAGEEELPTGAVNLQNIPPHLLPQQLDDSLPTHRRRPCYGWISDDEDDDFIDLRESACFGVQPMLGTMQP